MSGFGWDLPAGCNLNDIDEAMEGNEMSGKELWERAIQELPHLVGFGCETWEQAYSKTRDFYSMAAGMPGSTPEQIVQAANEHGILKNPYAEQSGRSKAILDWISEQLV